MKPRHLRQRSKKAGLPPGSLVYIGPKKTENVSINLFDYDQTTLTERVMITPEECATCKLTPTVSWVNVDGIHQVDILKTFGKLFNLHPLMLEDIANPDQRPKVDTYADQVYLVLKMLSYNKERHAIESEQLSIVLTPHSVLSFHEQPGDIFEPLRERIRNSKSRIRKEGVDYLIYSLIDAVVDNYFLILETLGTHIDLLSDELVSNPQTVILHKLHLLKRQVLLVRKYVWPLRELLANLTKEKPIIFKESTLLYLRDTHDHTIQVMDTIESFREMLVGMVDIYLSSINIKTNNTMRVLTTITTVFIPLSFITGIYGMNFKYMPELSWRLGYPLSLSVMLLTALGLLFFFKKKKWL